MISRNERSNRSNFSRTRALAIFLTTGFMILAVNGGMVFFQRNAAQNAAEAASLAGALALTQGYSLDQIEGLVNERARNQGFDPGDPDVTVDLAWISDVVGAGATFSNNLQVEITTEYTSLFSTIFSSSKQSLTVDALAHARIQEDLAPGYAIVALRDPECDSSEGCWQQGGNAISESPIPVTGGTQTALTEVPVPDCTGLLDYGEVDINTSMTLQPGKYSSIRVGEGVLLKLNPGQYCIYGAGSSGASFFLSETSQVEGVGVMMVLMDGAASFQASPNSAVYLYAPESLVDPSGQEWGGMLIYAHPNIEANFTFTGTSNSIYRGTIYAPGADCEIHGTAGFVTLKSQLICDSVDFTEVEGLYVSYDMSMNYHLPEAVKIMD